LQFSVIASGTEVEGEDRSGGQSGGAAECDDKEASHDFWGRQNCSPLRAREPTLRRWKVVHKLFRYYCIQYSWNM